MTTTDISRYGTLEATADGFVLRFERHFAVSPARLWQALTQPSEVAAWLAPMSGRIVGGGNPRFVFAPPGVEVGWRILECQPGELLVHTWDSAAGEPGSIVRWELQPEGDGTRLTLSQHFRTGADIPSATSGWRTHLDRLEQHLETSSEEGQA